MSEQESTVYRVLQISEGDYGCEEHAEPMANVLLEAADGTQKTLSFPDADLYVRDICEGDSVRLCGESLEKISFQTDASET